MSYPAVGPDAIEVHIPCQRQRNVAVLPFVPWRQDLLKFGIHRVPYFQDAPSCTLKSVSIVFWRILRSFRITRRSHNR